MAGLRQKSTFLMILPCAKRTNHPTPFTGSPFCNSLICRLRLIPAPGVCPESLPLPLANWSTSAPPRSFNHWSLICHLPYGDPSPPPPLQFLLQTLPLDSPIPPSIPPLLQPPLLPNWEALWRFWLKWHLPLYLFWPFCPLIKAARALIGCVSFCCCGRQDPFSMAFSNLIIADIRMLTLLDINFVLSNLVELLNIAKSLLVDYLIFHV